MNLDSLSLALSQISYLVSNLNKKNYKSSVQEVQQLVERHGPEADRHLFRCLFSSIDFSGDVKSGGKDYHQTQLLILECGALATKPNFISTLCHAIDSPLSHQKSLQPSATLLQNISRILRFNKVQEVIFGIALQHSSIQEIRKHATEVVKTLFPEVIRLHLESIKVSGRGANTQDIGLQDTAVEVLHTLLSYLVKNCEENSISTETKESFLVTLRSNFPVERCPVVLLPLLYREKEDLHMDRLLQDANGNAIHKGRVSMADILREIGYSACSSVEDCRKILTQYGVTINAGQVAQALGMMSSTISEPLDNIPSLQSLSTAGGWLDGKDKSDQYNSWNVENFVLALKDLNPALSFQMVMRELDYPHFVVNNAAAFQLLIRAIKSGVPPEERFPVEVFYKQWKNTNGQLSLIQQALLNPSVFCFADHPCHLCATDILKQPLDEDNKEIANWKSLNLVECLLQLSQNGHYEPVKMLFMWPAKHCPDLLMLSLLQITSPFHKLRQELISNLLPTFLNLHPNSGIILHCAWHGQGQCPAIRQLVMRSMADWYLRDQHEQQRLSRILDVAQDLKALSHLLNSTPFMFVIDLAVLASRREYLKLDKWLTDKIREHGETFVGACVNFLQKRSPSVMTGNDDGQPKNLQLPPETVATILVCLQSCAGNLSQPLTDTILGMVKNCNSLPKPRQAPPGILPSTRNTSTAPTSTILPESIGSKAVPTDHGFSNVTTQPAAPAQQNPQKDSNPLPNFGQLHAPGTPSSFASNVDSGLSLSTMTSGGPVGPMSGNVGSIGLPGQSHSDKMPGIAGNSSLSVGGLMGISGGSVGQLGSQLSSGFSSSFGATNNSSGVSAMNNTGIGPFGSQLGFGNQSMQGFGSSNQLLGDISSLNFGDSSSDQFQSKMEQAFSSQKTDLNKKVLDLFGQSKLGNINPTGGLGSLGQGMGAGLGVPGTVGGDPFGQKKTSAGPGLLGQATQQAFQQAGARAGKLGGGDLSQVWPDMTQQFSKEIEDEANSYFQKIYNQPPDVNLSVDDILGLLRKFKDSNVKKEKEVFNCMLRNLFEEYRFFPQYPDKELYTTACLFGGIIEKNLVPTYVVLGIALRYVLETLRKPHPNKMYYFGIAALDRFKNKLKDYPQYCLHIAGIPHFKDFPPNLIEYVEYGKLLKDPPSKTSATPTISAAPVVNPLQQAAMSPAAGSVTPTRAASSTNVPQSRSASAGPKAGIGGKEQPSIAKATNIDTLLGAQAPEEKIPEPPEATQDKIAFIFNNLSISNIQTKSEEMKEVIKDEYIAWLAQYFVMKRVSIEPNFHQLYSNFLDGLKIVKLTKFVQREVFRNITVLLQSDKIDANFSDRSLLKNLGHFLGMITLPKNKPILFEDIDLKSLLYEANMKGAQELLYVVPFVTKILESVGKSKVFKLPNPWTESLMSALVELHNVPELKLNLKFEVEVLCKNLKVDISDIKPSHYLRDPSHKYQIDYQLSSSSNKPQSKPGTPSTALDKESAQRMIPQNGMSLVSAPNVSSPAAAAAPVKNFNQPMMPSPMPQVSAAVPRFSLHDINIFSINTLQSHLVIKQDILKSIPIAAHPLIKTCVKASIERAVQELLQPVVERAIKVAMVTCEQIVKKDFALDPEEFRMRAAAQHMVRNLTAGLALIKCREPLIQSISNHLKNSLPQAMARHNGMSPPKDVIEQTALMIAQDNMEVACCFIQKTAIEKALLDIDKRMSVEFEHRKHARQEGRRYCDSLTLTYQAERMPEQIRLKVGGVTQQQTVVYDEFARCIPGFLPSNDISQPTGFLAKPMQTWPIDEVSQVFDRCTRELEQHIQTVNLPPGNPILIQLQNLSEGVSNARNTREPVAALGLLQKAVEGLLERLSVQSNEEGQNVITRYRECHILVLKSIQDPKAYGPQWTNKHVTRCLTEHRDEYKYNAEAVDILIKTHLVNLQQYDLHMAQSMENGLNYMAVQFAMQIVKRYLIEEKMNSPVSESDLYHTVETLVKINAHNQGTAPEGLSQLVSIIRANTDSIIDKVPGGPTHMMHSGISQAREFDDPAGLYEKAECLLREWVNIYHSPASGRDSTRGFSNFVQLMHQNGILRTDELITRFFRICTEICVDLTYRLLQESNVSPSLLNPTLVRAKCFHTLDAYVRLITLLVKHSGDASNSVTKINLLNKVLGIVVGVLQQDHDRRQTEFHQMPYHRIFIMLFYELNAPEHVLESINFQTLTAFTNTYHILRPGKVPAFAFAWLELISYRSFIQRMLLQTPQQKGWPMYAQLLIDLFKFHSPFLRNVDLTKPMQVLYRGTLRLLLVLLHDFPEFLCDYHYGFCDVIPANCVQLRNLILSAFPRNMRLPDPFTPNLKVDMLQEINSAPRILTNYVTAMPISFKKELDSYLQSRMPANFLSELRGSLQIGTDSGMKYNVTLMNSLVLYVGTQAIQYIHNNGTTPSMASISKCAHMDIFQHLSIDLDTEGRYLFLNAVANQLRYPNSHTHYFSCTLLFLFAEANHESIQEQITRVLLERLIVNRPHPWGLLITFIELIKNPSFKFWNHEFVHCAPEISKLFESVARSCMGKQFVQQAPRQVGPQTMTSAQQGTAPSSIETPASVTTTA